MEKEKKFTESMVDMYADKLLIGLTREENKIVLDEFEIIDETISAVSKIPNIESVTPMSWCLDRTIDFLREDVAVESTPVDVALANSKGANECEIEVPRVVSEE